jgi:hypothetical protein
LLRCVAGAVIGLAIVGFLWFAWVFIQAATLAQ